MTRRDLALVARMTLLGVAVAVLWPGLGFAQENTAQTRLKLAEEFYKKLQVKTIQALVAPPSSTSHSIFDDNLDGAKAEQFHLWSRRWMEAQQALGTNQEQRVAAIKDHLARMRDLEEGSLIKEWLKRSGHGDDFNAATNEMWLKSEFASTMKYFRVEAESWLEEAGGE